MEESASDGLSASPVGKRPRVDRDGTKTGSPRSHELVEGLAQPEVQKDTHTDEMKAMKCTIRWRQR